MKHLTPLVALGLLAACTPSSSKVHVTGTVTAQGAPSAQTANLKMTDDLTFVPNVVLAKVGRLTLDIDNSGLVPHNLVFADKALGGTDLVHGHATATLSIELSKVGTYRFSCTIHPGMTGKVDVAA